MNIKITQAAIEAGARALRDMVPDAMFTPYHAYLEQAKACITTALPHLAPPIQTTPAPYSLAEAAGEGGLNSEEVEVERVARAGYEGMYCKPAAIKWDELTDYSKSQWRRIARAAIRAIREGGERWGGGGHGSGRTQLATASRPPKGQLRHVRRASGGIGLRDHEPDAWHGRNVQVSGPPLHHREGEDAAGAGSNRRA